MQDSFAVDAVAVPIDHRQDVRGLTALIDEGRLRPDEVIAITGKIDGTGSGPERVEADAAMRGVLAEHGTRSTAEIERIPMVFTAGGLGILTPQVVVYSRRPAEPAEDGIPRLAVGTARSAVMQPAWTGTARVIEENVAAIRSALASAPMTAAEAEYVVGKTYYVPNDELKATGDPALQNFEEMHLFRLASGSGGLSAAVALDGADLPADEDIARRLELWSGKASFSSNPWEAVGGEGPHTQVIAMGNHAGAGGTLRVGHAVIEDLLDVQALGRALRRAGLEVGDGPLTPEQRKRVIAVYVKVGPAPEPLLRGHRQLSHVPGYGAELKSAVAGMFAGMLQDNLIYISGSATHQGPAGGGTIAVVVETA
ncbi:ring-opening amidohydrolase [Microbacterium sp. ASV81]|uniref:Ring-opening amidohydrolase n=1 Tax=Microbacterium capsulatum TaxID=3041921 RepID=A0ABU0XEN4_9MICO|nr:ring-opening amidohydrolase [Microbacterium sp. ASV81]MDQ4213580.1 ring-opening amidohydrolase [Microbacterium sp. ASV81]